MDKLLLVDGSNLLFQMFYGIPSVIIGTDGKSIQGTVGFAGALLKIIRMIKPTHLAVLFDGECHNSRSDLNPEYKANRPDFSGLPESELPFAQLPYIYRFLDHLGIKHSETTDCESDDWIASYAKQYKTRCEIVISSLDSDFYQLVSPTLSVLRYRGKESHIVTPYHIDAKFEIAPESYVDFKALVGDGSDNLKGAHKVGVKTATSLIKSFGNLENIIQNAHKIPKSHIRKAIESDARRLRLNYSLIKLEGNVPIPFPLEELAYTLPDITSTHILRDLGIYR